MGSIVMTALSSGGRARTIALLAVALLARAAFVAPGVAPAYAWDFD